MLAHVKIVVLFKACLDFFLAQFPIIINIECFKNRCNIPLLLLINQLRSNVRQRRLLQNLTGLEVSHILQHLVLDLLTNLNLTLCHPLML